MVVAEQQEAQPDMGGSVIELSINSLVGLVSPQTMKLKDQVKNEEVVGLIDLGTSHNFISVDLVQRLGLSIAAMMSYGILTGTGQSLQGGDVCRGLLLFLQTLEIMEDFLPIQLGVQMSS